MVDFFDVDALASTAAEMLDAPEAAQALGVAGRELIVRQYALPRCLEEMRRLYADVLTQAAAEQLPADAPSGEETARPPEPLSPDS